MASIRTDPSTGKIYLGEEQRLSPETLDEIAKLRAENERLRAYALRLEQRLDRAPDETRAIDAELARRQ